jgi:hypothetical protein
MLEGSIILIACLSLVRILRFYWQLFRVKCMVIEIRLGKEKKKKRQADQIRSDQIEEYVTKNAEK